jgi:DNA-binding PadR family transcriptional regulator
MIDLMILGLLKEQDLHGYELRKRVAELVGPGRAAMSFGSLYPALARLERAGLVKAVEALTRPAIPASGSLAGELAAFRARHRAKTGGRRRKVYGLTDRGEAHLIELLTDPEPVDDRGFALRVAFCRFLTPSQRLELFERRRAEIAERLSARHRPATGHDSLLDRYLRSLRDHDTEALNHDLAWLDRLIEGERAEPAAPMEELPT